MTAMQEEPLLNDPSQDSRVNFSGSSSWEHLLHHRESGEII